MRLPAITFTLLALFLIFTMAPSNAASIVSQNITSHGQITTNTTNWLPFSTGREYAYFYNQRIPVNLYEYVHTQGFASLTPTGDLIARHEYSDGNEYGNHGANWLQVENILRNAKTWGAIPIIRIWLFNLDMSDEQWNIDRRDTPMTITNPQPKITYDALESFMAKLEQRVENAGIETMIFIPCWEFNQAFLSRQWWWGEGTGGSYRDWNIEPAAYESFMGNLVAARDAAAPRVRIGVAPDSAHGRINWTTLNYDQAWNNNYGKTAFELYLNGFRKINFAFDEFGVSCYPRNLTPAMMANQQLFNDLLGEQWMKRIADLVGIGNAKFNLWEWNGDPNRADTNFVINTYGAITRSIDLGILRYSCIGWYMNAPDSTINQMAIQYNGYGD